MHPKAWELIFDICEYEVRRGQADRLMEVADLGTKVAAADPRVMVYRAVGLILKNEEREEARGCGPEERKGGRGRAVVAGIFAEGAEAFWLSAICGGARVAGALV